MSFPSGDSDSFAYDPNTGRPTKYSFVVNGASDTGTLSWNANGTLGSYAISDSLPGTSDSQSCSYSYDDLARSAGVSCGSKGSQTFTYDVFGNISKTANGFGLSFQPSGYNAANQPVGVGMSFDADGNVLQDNLGTQYTWDPNFGNPASINSINLIYDALGQMVEQQNGSTYTEMLYSQAGKTAIMNGQSLQKTFIPLPGGETAIYNSSATLAFYRHADWLGSSRLTTTTSRTVSSSSAYASFGQQYATSGSTDASFTGQNSNTVSGLYDFVFREFSPSMGRWTSPDPAGVAVADPTNPQSWNRYAYVNNYPLNNVDPLGLVTGPPCDLGQGYCPPTDPPGTPPCMSSQDPGCGPIPCGPENINECEGPPPPSPQQPSCGNGINCNTGAPNSGPQKTSCTVNKALAAVPGAAATGINDPVNGHLEVGISFTAATLQADGFHFFQGPFGANGYRLGNVFVSAHVNGVGAQLSPSSFLNAPGGIVNGEVHFDTFNPSTGLFGLVGHTIWDYLIGHLFPHKAALDPGC